MIHTAADSVYAVDVSSHQTQFQNVLDAVKLLTEMTYAYNPDVHIGMVTFSDIVSTAFDINEHTTYNSLLSATQQVRQDTHTGSLTNVTSVLQYIKNVTLTHANVRNNSRKFVTLFTNGECTKANSIKAMVDELYNMNIYTQVVVIGDFTDLDCYFTIFSGSDVIFIGDIDSDMERLNYILANTKYASCPATIFSDRK